MASAKAAKINRFLRQCNVALVEVPLFGLELYQFFKSSLVYRHAPRPGFDSATPDVGPRPAATVGPLPEATNGQARPRRGRRLLSWLSEVHEGLKTATNWTASLQVAAGCNLLWTKMFLTMVKMGWLGEGFYCAAVDATSLVS